MRKDGRHLLKETSKVTETLDIVILHLQTVVRNSSGQSFMAVDGIKVQAELTTSLTERVLGNSVPESVLSTGWTEAYLAGDDVDFVDALCYHVVDVVSHLSRKTS